MAATGSQLDNKSIWMEGRGYLIALEREYVISAIPMRQGFRDSRYYLKLDIEDIYI